MADTANPTPGCNLVAIDIGRYSNAVLIEAVNGKRHRFKMANTAADFERLLSFLRTLPGTCRVGLEPKGDCHLARLLTFRPTMSQAAATGRGCARARDPGRPAS